MVASSAPVVATTNGKIEGIREDGLSIFRGIPYAAPPVGEKRWRAPEPAKPWRWVRATKVMGKVAPQNPPASPILLNLEMLQDEVQSEDCLYLNVWTPGIDKKRRPVLFWIHGGAFQQGAGSRPNCDGKVLATRGDVVVVTINYRLGSLGFLNFHEITGGAIPASGNEGLLDQIAALEWVRDNISNFGGDPTNITIFGESAGGMSVATLLAMPEARGLFHRAICQSGAASSVYTLEQATRVAGMFLEAARVEAADSAGLCALTPERLLPAQTLLARMTWRSDLRVTMCFMPVVDGRRLPDRPLNAIEQGATKTIPLLVGTTLQEWQRFAVADPRVAALDDAGLVGRLEKLVPAESISGLVAAYRRARARRGESTLPGDLFTLMQTDRMFRLPAIHLLEAQQKHINNVFSYIFTWASPALGGRLGACHGIDIGFVFGTHEAEFAGAGAAADLLSRRIQDAWLNFARTGDPSCESLGSWPPYGAQRQTMFLGKECSVVPDPFSEECRAWEKVPREKLGMV